MKLISTNPGFPISSAAGGGHVRLVTMANMLVRQRGEVQPVEVGPGVEVEGGGIGHLGRRVEGRSGSVVLVMTRGSCGGSG